MRAEMTFDSQAIVKNGFERENIYDTLEAAFTEQGLKCVVNAETFVVEDTGDENDFANIFNVLLDLLLAEWFIQCATSCYFYDDNGTVEDVLVQAEEIQRMLA